MRRDLRAKLTLNDMARAVNLTSFHFCHLFKAETGKSPAKYLKSLRLERARELLETTFLSVKEIRALVGLNDESHFARDFRAAYGLTPQQHREHFLGLATADRGRSRAEQDRLLNSNIGQEKDLASHRARE
ncbi:MAG TPA: helix-turn-helix transcriptional regulator [Pyrinomonadaceae bacterium]|nr:helix-turn-helix transcriptional regulator [Pyrinomonadaceae bacterium]